VLARGMLVGVLVDGRWVREVHRWALRKPGWALEQHTEGARVQVAGRQQARVGIQAEA